MRIALAIVAAVSALAVAGAAGAVTVKKGPPKPELPTRNGVCTNAITGRVAGDLIVPAGATCNASGADVQRSVRVARNATLSASGSFSAGRGIDVARGATLQLTGTELRIAGTIEARGAKKVALSRQRLAGSNGTIGGSVLLFGTADVSVLSLTIGGMVLVRGGGADGVGVGGNRIFRSLEVTQVRMLHPSHPRVFSIHSNVVSRDVRVSGNNATGATAPPFVGGNRLVMGTLTCRANQPAPVNTGPSGRKPNVVLTGRKRGQCARL